MADILILSGPPGAGKSAVSEALGDRYDRVAHVPVDVLRHFVTATGYARPGTERGRAQIALGVRNACSLACNFVEARFGVIIDDIVAHPEMLDGYLEGLKACGVPVHFIRLMPTLAECELRDKVRAVRRIPPGHLEAVYAEIEAAGPFAGATIDSTDLTVEETADRVQALTTAGQSIVWLPKAQF